MIWIKRWTSEPPRPLSEMGLLRRRPIFLVGPAHHDLERIIRQRPLQRLRLIPWCVHPDIALFAGITGMALGWIGFTTATRLRGSI